MPRVADADRKRARRPKTKTGCGTCKIRRVKCGEEKPACHRCVSTGRKCDGYDGTLTASKSHSPPEWKVVCRKTSALATPPASRGDSPGSNSLSTRSNSPIPIQPSSVFSSDRERDAFSFFLTRTCTQLGGFYTCDFWQKILPQAAHVDTGIRHAVLALSSVHRLFEETGDADRVSDVFGTQHYQLAIQQHITDMQSLELNSKPTEAAFAAGKGKEGLERYIASSMLFICIEMLQGHYVSAISLTKVAVRLFYDYIVPSSWIPTSNPHAAPFSAWPLTVLEFLLSRLQFGAVGLIGRASVGVLVAPRIRKMPDWDAPEVPPKFSSIEAARNFLDLFNWAHAFSSHDPDMHGVQDDLRDPTMRRTHLVVFQQWSDAFDALLADLAPDKLTQRDKNAIAVLKIRRLQSSLSFDMVVRDELGDCNPMLWDEHVPGFAQALDWIEPVLLTQDNMDRVHAPPTPLSSSSAAASGSSPPHTPPSTRHLFTLDFGLVGPLFEIGRLCRDPSLRRRSIALLRQHPMREGMWDGLLAARACEAQMELEEGMALSMRPELAETGGPQKAEDIPRDARIICMLPHFVPGQRWAKAFFSKLPSRSPTDERPAEWHFEGIIEW